MNVEIVPAAAEQRPVIDHLIQLYLYDFSEFMGWDVDSSGRFGKDALNGCWTEPWRHPYLIKADGKLAGFAIVDERDLGNGRETVVDMAEFFVLRRFRRCGVGQAAATALFDLFPARRWRVRQVARNESAIAFWRHVIATYTCGQYQEETWHDDGLYNGPEQYFGP